MSKRTLILEDGHVFEGVGFGGDNFQVGELIFHTGMMSYQDVLSNPNYCAQLVCMTYPMIGSYGINRDEFESLHPAVFGLIVGEFTEMPCNWRSEMSLEAYMKMKGIPGIADIDTRMLTKILRNKGTMKAVFVDGDYNAEEVVARIKAAELPVNQVESVSIQRSFQIPSSNENMILVDFGTKNGIIRELNMKHFNITVVPYNTSAADILSLKPAGVVLSDGPGNPCDVPAAIEMVQEVMGKVPMMGIGLGHLVMAKACGAETAKLTFGHHGTNHPVLRLDNGQTLITTQNHSYVVVEENLPETLIVTHRALNDKSVEGLKHMAYPMFSVQFQPGVSVDPNEENELFTQFYQMIEEFKEAK